MNLKQLSIFVLLLSLLISCKETNDELLDKAYKLNTQKKYDQAIKIYNEVINRNNKLQLAFYNRGFAYLQLKKYNEALADFNSIISEQTDGNFVITYNKVLPHSDEELSAQVSFYDALYQRAQVKYYMDSLGSSFADFQRLVDDNYEEKSNCMSWQGTIYIRSGNSNKACEYFYKSKQFALNDEDRNDADEMIKTYCGQTNSSR
jgi:tetratricopeptide (TPR) repeat protein